MTERSWFWGGTTVGDASLAPPYGAPYSDDMFSDKFGWILAENRSTQGVLRSSHTSFSTNLAVSNIGGDTIRIAPGMALVDGKLYQSDANVDIALTRPGSGTNYYRIVLRKSWAAQTVRNTVLGPVLGSYPSIIQTDGTTWDLNIANVTLTSAGTLTIVMQQPWVYPASKVSTAMLDDLAVTTAKIDNLNVTTAKIADLNVTTAKIANTNITVGKMAVNSVDSAQYVDGSIDQEHLSTGASKVTNRKGGNANVWWQNGSNDYALTSARIQLGMDTVVTSGTKTFTYPVAFAYTPILFVQGFLSGVGLETPVNDYHIKNESASSFQIEGGLSISYIRWLAMGPT